MQVGQCREVVVIQPAVGRVRLKRRVMTHQRRHVRKSQLPYTDGANPRSTLRVDRHRVERAAHLKIHDVGENLPPRRGFRSAASDRQGRHGLTEELLHRLRALPQPTSERLVETLLAWCEHWGNRQAVAAQLHIHPQTVSYRVSKARKLLGDAINDPERRLGFLLALTSENGRRS